VEVPVFNVLFSCRVHGQDGVKLGQAKQDRARCLELSIDPGDVNSLLYKGNYRDIGPNAKKLQGHVTAQ